MWLGIDEVREMRCGSRRFGEQYHSDVLLV
jgi:hypothetical protein